MALIDVVAAPWALLPETLHEIRTVYETHLRGERIDVQSVEARIGRPLSNEPAPYQVVSGVAVVPMVGVVAKRASLFMEVSGGVSTQIVQQHLLMAMEDPAVHSVILQIDSPGGTVDGVQQLADTVRTVREQKPVVTLADGVMASGGYWVGCAADQVYIADRTTMVGSIGVVATHVDISRREEQAGVKTTEITAGKFKRISSNYAPLSPEGRQTMQEMVDQLYTVFVEAVAENRGASVEQVLSDMADGRVFVGQQAIDAGLVDGISTLDALVAQLAETNGRGSSARTTSTQPKGKSMDQKQLQAEHPALFEAITSAARDEGHKAGLAAGATAERERILGIEANALPGHEKLVAELKADGKTTPDQAAARIVAAERGALTAAGKDLQADAPAVAPAADAPNAAPSADLPAQAQDLAAKEGISLVAAFKRLGVK